MPFPSLPKLFNAVLPRLTPYRAQGVSGTPVYGGYVISPEKNPKLVGQQKYATFADILANTSIVAAGVRYFLNIVARPEWSCEPADQSDEAKKAAEFVEQILFEDLHTPWSRVVRRAGTYRFYGFNIQEWTAVKRDDGKIGFNDIEARPQWTIWRWEIDEKGKVVGAWQRDPLTGRELGLPRGKIMYLVDDTLTDNPEGMGLLRHVVDPVERLIEYQIQEGYGFLRDLRGIPIGRAPIEELNAAVAGGLITSADRDRAVDDMMQFISLEKKSTKTAMLLNSQPYLDRSDTSQTMASQYKWDVQLLNGAAPGLGDVHAAINRLNTEIARILGIEHLMLGSTSAGSFALAKEKASNLYLLANSVLRDIRLQAQHDLLWPLWKLNGWDDKLMPELKSEDVAPKDVVQVAQVLAAMATAGAPVPPGDTGLTNWVRDLLGAPTVDMDELAQTYGLDGAEHMIGLPNPQTLGSYTTNQENNEEDREFMRENRDNEAQTAADEEDDEKSDVKKYDDSEPRDDHGRWTAGGAGGGGASNAGGSAKTYYGGFSAGDATKFKDLKASWAKVNNGLLQYLDKPDSPEAQGKMRELEGITKQMASLHADPGTAAGIGLPGGPRDVTIVGAGPGGLSASIMGAAEGLDTAVVEANAKAGGQAKFSSRIENFPGFPAGASGERLTQNMYQQATRLGAEAKLGVRVTGMTYDPATGLKTLALSNGESITTRSVILAGGVEFRRMSFPGSEGSGVIYGDGKSLATLTAGKNALVIGGSNGAAQAALGTATKADHVYLMARSPITDSMSDYQVAAVKNNPKITVIEGDSISKLNRDAAGNPVSAETAGGKKLDVNGVGIFIGSVPDTKWVPPEVARDKSGRVHTDGNLETGVPGVFAIGDMREGAIGRIGVAVGEGQLALRHAYQYLDKMKEAAGIPVHKSLPVHISMDELISRLFALDREHPYLGQTVEGSKLTKRSPGVSALRPFGKFSPDEARDEHGRWTAGGADAAQTATKEFKSWFGKSKVVDSHGRPLLVYRGDLPNKTAFTGREDKSNYIQGNVLFTDDPHIGKFYVRNAQHDYRTDYMTSPDDLNETHGLYRAYLSIKKPLVIDAKEEGWDSVPVPRSISGTGRLQVDDLAVEAKKRGYDGLIVKNVFDQAGLGTQYVVYHPDQIKLAKGKWSQDVKKFSDDEARDQHGRWTAGGSGVDASGRLPTMHDPAVKEIEGYHGTTKEVLGDILKNGLIPHKSEGGDKWAQDHGSAVTFSSGTIPGREHSVYFTSNKHMAAAFANLAANQRHGHPALLELHVPKSEAALHLHPDEAEDPNEVQRNKGFQLVRYEGTIKPEWIKPIPMPADVGGVGVFDSGKHTWSAVNKAADDVVLYAIVYTKPSLSKYSPDQLRDDHGRWTEGGAGGGFSAAKEALKTPGDEAGGVALGRASEEMAKRLFPGGYDVAPDAPNTFEDLVKHWSGTHRMKVFDGASGETIFENPKQNYAFRAWHDHTHLRLMAPFTPEGEHKVAEGQIDDLRKVYGDGPETQRMARLLHAEIDGQVAYAKAHKGEFPVNQKAYDLAWLKDPKAANDLYKFMPQAGAHHGRLRDHAAGISHASFKPSALARKVAYEIRQHRDTVLQPLAKYSPDQARDYHGRWTGGGAEEDAFVSPNVGNTDFSGAKQALAGQRHQMIADAVASVDKELGIQSKVKDVIGAWADGAEDSTMSVMHGASWHQLLASGAMKGHIAKQKQVLVFQEGRRGDSFISSFPAKGSLDEIHKYLLGHGLDFHTLEPTSDGAVVHVFGQNEDTLHSVESAGKHYGSSITTRVGHGTFIPEANKGDSDEEQRQDARRVYSGVIARSRAPGARAAWDRVRHRYSGADVVKRWYDATKADLRKEFDPNEPRDDHGRWTEGGGSAAGPGAGKPQGEYYTPHPDVMNVGGDEWNRGTAVRLEHEYVAAKPKIDAIAKDAVGQNASTELPSAKWDDLSGDTQDEAEQHFKDSEYESVYQSEVDNWHENGDAMQDAMHHVAYDYKKGNDQEWAENAIDKLNEDREEAGQKPLPFDRDTLLNAIEVDFEPNTGDTKPSITFNDDKLQHHPDVDTSPQFAGFEKPDASKLLTPDMRAEIANTLQEEFRSKAEDVESDMEPPEYLQETAQEDVQSQWDEMDDNQKFKYAKENLGSVDDDSYSSDELDRLPKKFDPLENSGDTDDYRRTQQFAHIVSQQRAVDLIKERGLLKPENLKVVADANNNGWTIVDQNGERQSGSYATPEAADKQLGFMQSARMSPTRLAQAVREADHELWSDWKGSSTSNRGKLIQIATADELGGRLRPFDDATYLKTQFANKEFAGIGGYEGLKALIRAKWETSQYMLDKAGVHNVELFRAVNMGVEVEGPRKSRLVELAPQSIGYDKGKRFSVDPPNELGGYAPRQYFGTREEAQKFADAEDAKYAATKERTEQVAGSSGYGTYIKLPDLKIIRNGAASTSTDMNVSNDWGTSNGRVVLRTKVPRTAVISVPAYGQNVHSEHEVVVAGTAWHNWDAWLHEAPSFKEVPLDHLHNNVKDLKEAA